MTFHAEFRSLQTRFCIFSHLFGAIAIASRASLHASSKRFSFKKQSALFVNKTSFLDAFRIAFEYDLSARIDLYPFDQLRLSTLLILFVRVKFVPLVFQGLPSFFFRHFSLFALFILFFCHTERGKINKFSNLDRINKR